MSAGADSSNGGSESAHRLLQAAQVNLDLYQQLHDAGWSAAELGIVRDAYLLAMRLFSDRFRANGKPFVAHLVGTASILAMVGARPAVVVAGLLHAAYANGVFPDGFAGVTDRHRRIVRDATGAEPERLVAAYQALAWKPAVVAPLIADWAAVGPELKDVLLMRMANALEDHLGLGMRLCDEGRGAFGVQREDHIRIATLLGQPALAVALAEAYRLNDAAEWAAPIALARDISFRLQASSSLTGSQHLSAAFRAAVRKLRRLARPERPQPGPS
jgi:hypothetical protein